MIWVYEYNRTVFILLKHPFFLSSQSMEGWIQLILPHFEDALEGQVKWLCIDSQSSHFKWNQIVIIPRLEVERLNQYFFYPQEENLFDVKLINDLGEFLGHGSIVDNNLSWQFSAPLFKGKEVYSLMDQQYDCQVEYQSADGASTQIHGSIYPV